MTYILPAYLNNEARSPATCHHKAVLQSVPAAWENRQMMCHGSQAQRPLAITTHISCSVRTTAFQLL